MGKMADALSTSNFIRRGSRQTTSRLEEPQAQAILDAAEDVSDTELARQYGISVPSVKAIRSRRSWKHLKRTRPFDAELAAQLAAERRRQASIRGGKTRTGQRRSK